MNKHHMWHVVLLSITGKQPWIFDTGLRNWFIDETVFSINLKAMLVEFLIIPRRYAILPKVNAWKYLKILQYKAFLWFQKQMPN